MVQVTLYWGGSALVGLESLGHSGSAPEGQDVVCAAVSALIRVFWPEEAADSLDLLTRTVALSLEEIESGYPGYVSITEVQR